jgi:hypothetical protein
MVWSLLVALLKCFWVVPQKVITFLYFVLAATTSMLSLFHIYNDSGRH